VLLKQKSIKQTGLILKIGCGGRLVAVGEEAPNFILETDEKRQVSLKDFRGKKVVLYFYPKDGTPGCTTEALEFKDVAEQFSKEGAVILGISKDSVESHQKFKEKHQLPFTLLSDPEAKVLNDYGVWKEKVLYGRKFMGTERTTFLIDEKGIMRKIYRKVKPEGHAQACLLDLTRETRLFLPD
jgi:peroxiredoxin Q/BCP